MSKDYSQSDSRWGSKNYNGSNYAAAGCGPTSLADILVNIDKSITPLTTGTWLRENGLIEPGNGTKWAGIWKCLQHYGCVDAHEVNVASSMDEVWKYLKKGYFAIFDFRGGSRGGVTWTLGGHYVAILGYYEGNGDHICFTGDSGGRNHDGWYSYKKTMQGLIQKAWVAKVPWKKYKKPSGTYSGTIPAEKIKLRSRGSDVKNWQKFLNWYFNKTVCDPDGDFGFISDEWTRIYQDNENLTPDGIVGSGTLNHTRITFAKQAPNGRKLIAPLTKVTSLEIMTSYVGQSLAIIDSKHRAVFYSHKTNGSQKCRIYNDLDKTNKVNDYSSLGHCNGATYAEGSFYVCSYQGSRNTKKISVIDANTLKIKKTINAAVALSGIAYHKGQWVGSKGSNIYVFANGKLKMYTKFKLKFTDGTPQDICVHNSIIYVCRSYVSGKTSCIDTYDLKGGYIGSYTIPENELESMDIDENGIIHYITWNAARLVKTKEGVK